MLVLTVFIKTEDEFLFHYPFWFFVYFFAGTAIYLFIIHNFRLCLGILIMDFFAALLYQYFDPHLVFMEVLWIPGILMTVAVVAPAFLVVPLTASLGLPIYLFMSYGFNASILVTIGDRQYPYSAISLFYYIPVTFFAIMIGRIAIRLNKLQERAEVLELINLRLNSMNSQISQKMFSLHNDTTMEERKRISKEIHDTAGYVFINLIMMLQAVSAILYKDTCRAAQLIDDARNYAERGINEIRHILRNIRDYSPVSLSLQNDLFEIGESFRRATGVKLVIDYGNWSNTFTEPIDAFFRSFMQETLTNALKHGQATAVMITCWVSETHVSMCVANNGESVSQPIKRGMGIAAMEDFLSKHDGTIVIQIGNREFKITAAIPKKSLRWKSTDKV
jgi:signal transduction histidine kinase